MELRQLKHFLAVIDCESLGDAARKLGISQPTLTRSIQSLEHSLGARLFSRDNQRMTLNQFGHALEIHARTLSTVSDRARSSIRELLGAQRGKVTIGSGPVLIDSILPIAASRFRDVNPGIDLSIVEGTLPSIMPALKSGAIDCLFFAMSSKLVSPLLRNEVFLPRQPVFVVTRSDNPLLTRPNLKAKDVLDATWLVAAPSDFRRTVEQTFHRLNLPAPVPAIESASLSATKKMLMMGHYLAVMPRMVLRDEIKQNILRPVPIPELYWECDPGALFRRDTPLMPATERFVAMVRSVCAEFIENDDWDVGKVSHAAASIPRITRKSTAQRNS